LDVIEFRRNSLSDKYIRGKPFKGCYLAYNDNSGFEIKHGTVTIYES
jgi:hypothetical protein